MKSLSRDRITVDLGGLKAPLLQRAEATGVLPSALVRQVLAAALDEAAPLLIYRVAPMHADRAPGRARISLRMSRSQASAVYEAARQAGLSPGDFVAKLVASVPAIAQGSRWGDQVAALTGSSSVLASLSRQLAHSNLQLRNGALAMPAMCTLLDDLARGITTHLKVASSVLHSLRPRDAAERDSGL